MTLDEVLGMLRQANIFYHKGQNIDSACFEITRARQALDAVPIQERNEGYRRAETEFERCVKDLGIVPNQSQESGRYHPQNYKIV